MARAEIKLSADAHRVEIVRERRNDVEAAVEAVALLVASFGSRRVEVLSALGQALREMDNYMPNLGDHRG